MNDSLAVANLVVQLVLAASAVGAAVVALVIGALDRRTVREIAAEDRRASLEHAKLMFDLEALLRLSQNLERGGHTDSTVSKDMGAEAAALVNLIGPERLPVTWAAKRGSTLDEAREFAAREDTPPFKKHSIEVHLELDRVAQRIRELAERNPSGRHSI